MLYTHRGLSGPAVLQISSDWRVGDSRSITLCPGVDLFTHLRARRAEAGAKSLASILAELLPKRVAQHLVSDWAVTGNIGDQPNAKLRDLADRLAGWVLTPTSSEGYRTAEVTLGGVATEEISSKTMQSQRQPGLFIIGEALDVTGWLGGYNFQWAWSSAVAAGRAIAANA